MATLVNMDALVREVYAAGDARKCGWSRHKTKGRTMQSKVHQRPVELPDYARHCSPSTQPPIVHAPCERVPFDPDAARARAAEWALDIVDIRRQKVVRYTYDT